MCPPLPDFYFACWHSSWWGTNPVLSFAPWGTWWLDSALPFRCPPCRRGQVVQVFTEVRWPFHSPSLNFSDRGGVLGSREWLQASRVTSCLAPGPPTELSIWQPLGLWQEDPARGHWPKLGLKFLRGLWNFLETDRALSAAHSLERGEQGVWQAITLNMLPP